MPDPAGHDGDHLVAKLDAQTSKIEPTWIPEKVPDAGPIDGKSLVTLGGKWVVGTGSASDERSFDAAQGLLGTCVIELLPNNNDNAKVTFTGKAVFCDDSTGEITYVDPIDASQLDLTAIRKAGVLRIFIFKKTELALFRH